MRGVVKMLLAAALAAALATALAACGGGDSATSTTTTTTTTTTQEAPPATVAPDRVKAPTSKPEGGGSFRKPGADNSIQDYGEEAADAELEAASEVVLAFMRARARADWETACIYMSKSALKPLEQLASSSPEFEGKGCADVLEAFLGSTPGADRASTVAGGIGSLRVEGEQAFALYHGTDGRDYFLPLVEEDGEWKVGALAESPLPG